MTTDEDWRAPGTPSPPSPVLTAALTQLDAAYDALFSISPTTLSDEDLTRLVDATTRLADRAAGAVTAAVGEADHRHLGDVIGARHTGQWWAQRTRLTRPETHRLTRLSRLLGTDLYAPVHTALAAGELHLDQASVITHAVEAIPSRPEDLPTHAEAPAVLKARAVTHLLTLAAGHDAKALKMLGRRILDLVAPEIGEAAEAKALADEEATAEAKISLTLRDNHDGTTTGKFTLPTPTAEMLRKHLMALTTPAVPYPAPESEQKQQECPTPAPVRDVRDERSWHTRLGTAFIDWIERYSADLLPTTGGVSATVVVTMTLDTLTGGLAAASLDTGTKITAAHARRLACEAGIIPAVLGGPSEILDLGRKRRFHTRAQRLAIAHRDKHCTTVGCDLPPAACHVHHDQPWSKGGPTNTTTGRLLCHRHHRVIHDPHYDTTHHPDGTISFHRRI